MNSKTLSDQPRFSLILIGFVTAFALLPVTGCSEKTTSETLALKQQQSSGPLLMTAISPQPTWLKQKEGNNLIKKCQFPYGTILELTEKADPAGFQGHVFVKLKGKTFATPSDNQVEPDLQEDTENPSESTSPTAQTQTSSHEGEEEEYDPTRPPKKSNLLANASDPEPVVCELTEGYIWPEHWEGFVLEKTSQVFPVAYTPLNSCLSSNPREAAFGAPRKGRLHAACDFHTNRNSSEGVYAIEDGVVLGTYGFGQGLECAIEVRHPSFVARYGEISCAGRIVRPGQKVKAGQRLSKVGTIWVRRDVNMLHMELYTGTASGALSQPGSGKYSRRRDLFNPTSFLKSIFSAKPARN